MTRPPCVVVTGAGGFLGSAIAEALTAAGLRVRAHYGPDDDVPARARSVDAMQFDIVDRARLRGLIDGADVVVHAAGPPSVARSFLEPAEYARAHLLGTALVSETMRESAVRFIVYISSAEIYGAPNRRSVSEDQPPDPRSPYAAAKLAAESFLRAAALTNGLAGYLLRPFSIYGSRMNPISVCGEIVSQLRRGENVVLNDLRPIRDYCYVRDVADAVVRAVERRPATIIPLNVGTGVGTSVGALAQFVGSAMGRRAVVVERSRSKRPADAEISRLVADTRAIEELLGWRPAYALVDGLRDCLGSTAA